MTDKGGGVHDQGTLTSNPPSGASWISTTVQFQYSTGGCWNSGTTALDVNIVGGGLEWGVSETSAGSGSYGGDTRTFSDGTLLGSQYSLDFVQTEGWTPAFQGTCHRNAYMSVVWQIPYSCP